VEPYTKHTLFAIAAGFWITNSLVLDFWPQVALGLVLASLAKILSVLEENGQL
jgi:hypothetical protein